MSDPMRLAGSEWVIDALDCAPDALRDVSRLRALADTIVTAAELRPAAPPLWKQFGGEAGVTGLLLLSESHLTVHTFPEHGTAAVNLYHCTGMVSLDWQALLRETLGASDVVVRSIPRVGTRIASPPPTEVIRCSQ